MVLHEPFKISSRLMAAVQIGGATISIEYGEWTADGRMQWHAFIDLPDGSEHEIDDMRSGVGGGTLQDAFCSMLGFLAAAAESYRYREFVQKQDRYIVGHNTNKSFPRRTFRTESKAADYLATLWDKAGVANGDYYIDDMAADTNEALFTAPIVEWAYQHSDDISMLELEIEESDTPLIEE